MFGKKPDKDEAQKLFKAGYDKSVEIAKAFQNVPDGDDPDKNKSFAKEQIKRGKEFISTMKKFADDFDLDI